MYRLFLPSWAISRAAKSSRTRIKKADKKIAQGNWPCAFFVLDQNPPWSTGSSRTHEADKPSLSMVDAVRASSKHAENDGHHKSEGNAVCQPIQSHFEFHRLLPSGVVSGCAPDNMVGARTDAKCDEGPMPSKKCIAMPWARALSSVLAPLEICNVVIAGCRGLSPMGSLRVRSIAQVSAFAWVAELTG